jgi:hypothetical protein
MRNAEFNSLLKLEGGQSIFVDCTLNIMPSDIMTVHLTLCCGTVYRNIMPDNFQIFSEFCWENNRYLANLISSKPSIQSKSTRAHSMLI